MPAFAWSAGKQPIDLFASEDLAFLAQKDPILMIGGMHGDEPEGVRLAQDLLAFLERNTEPLLPWLLLPCLNPDGFAKGERTNGHGVDINRNFPSPCWTAQAERNRYYPGPHPGSEPETQVVLRLLQDYHPRLVIHFHSWQPCVVYSGIAALPAAKALAAASQYPLQEDIGYPSPGSLGEYARQQTGLGVVCIEEQDGGTELENVFARFAPALLQILKGEIS